MDHTVLPANYTMPAFTPQPQSITAPLLVGLYSFYRPTESRRLSRPGWLVTYRKKCRIRKSNPDTVTYPSTNRAQRRLTSLIGTNDVTIRHAATYIYLCDCICTTIHTHFSLYWQCCARYYLQDGFLYL